MGSAPGSHHPRLALALPSPTVFPSSPVSGHATPAMASIGVRVVPRSGRTGVEVGPDGPVVRVRSVPEGGKANQEAIRVLAAALGVPRTDVRLRSGARSRSKVFDVEGLSLRELERRLQGC